MELLLHRKILNENSTEGNLYINKNDGNGYIWFCNTLEDKVRAAPGEWRPELKIYAKTAIPYGRYPVIATWSNRFKRILTGVFNVPDFTGIRIHNGTSELNSAGCIIVSYKDNDALHTLINDKHAMNDLCDLVQLKQVTEKIYINIVAQMPE